MKHDLYDALIIGSGAGGAAAAYRLTRAGLNVLLLEKGSELPTDGSTLDIERVVHRGEFLSRESWRDGRGRSLQPEERFNVGGKTRWYGAALLRYGAHEFAADPAHQCAGWPIAYGDLESYYSECERLLGVRHFECEPDLARILRRLAARAPEWRGQALPLGLMTGILNDRHEASHFDGFASVGRLKSDAESAFLQPIAGASNFRLETQAEVVALLAQDNDSRSIAGVRLRDGREFRARHTILAAGALHSPRLLQRYLEEHRLADRLPMSRNVGRGLKLHLLTAMVAVTPARQRDLLRKTTLLVNERFPHSSVQPLGFDGELIGTLVPKLVPRWLANQVGSCAYGFFLQTEDGSDAANRVGADAGDSRPILDYDARRVAPARREHRRFTRAFQLALLKAGFISFTQRIGLNGTAHACGSLMTGADPATSVVDPRGAVHGLESLYVVDGSVLPRSSRVNPSLTIFAWALRVADLLAARQRAAPHAVPESRTERDVALA
ncbi:MAG TPA: GMC family oxidoreductase [Steroidobacteraceae bacterium]|nr:GMC family oxidoreductase [Steroidobacteraceae bacterium]